MTKNELRKYFREKRAGLSDAECRKLDDLLLIKFQQLEIIGDPKIILSYNPIDLHKEVNTHLLTSYLRFRIPELQLAFPVANFIDHSMEAVLVVEESQFVINSHGIWEPLEGKILDPFSIDWVMVPLLVFDFQGYRVGFGKGFYDRFLARCRPDVLKIGFSYFDPVNRIDDLGQFDVPLDFGITPKDIYEF
jgi:5-formyltetrahydrofolate cyclo-ligase